VCISASPFKQFKKQEEDRGSENDERVQCHALGGLAAIERDVALVSRRSYLSKDWSQGEQRVDDRFPRFHLSINSQRIFLHGREERDAIPQLGEGYSGSLGWTDSDGYV